MLMLHMNAHASAVLQTVLFVHTHTQRTLIAFPDQSYSLLS